MSTDSSAQYFVLYALGPSGPLARTLKDLMGPSFNPGPLPCEAGPFSPAEADAARARLGAAKGYLGPFGGLMQFQPAQDAIAPLSRDEAEHLAHAAAEEEMQRSSQEKERAPTTWSWVGAFELPRCWAFLFYFGPNIPPGLAVVVDKHSRTPIVLRYIDVEPVLARAGFDVTPASGRTLRAPGSWRPPTKAHLTKGMSLEEHALYRQPDGTKMCLEVWVDPDGWERIEVDTAKHRFRWAAEAPTQLSHWEPYED